MSCLSVTRPLLTLALVAATAAPARAWSPLPVDKAAHFGLSYVVMDQLMRAGVPVEQALVATMLVGWLKEVTDGEIDGGDLAADAAGCLAAGFLRVQFRW